MKFVCSGAREYANCRHLVDRSGRLSRPSSLSGPAGDNRPKTSSPRRTEYVADSSQWDHTVGLTGFEPAASSSRTRRATKLRHSPMRTGKVGRPVRNPGNLTGAED